MRTPLALFALALLAEPASAATPRLVRDINVQPVINSSSPREFVGIGADTYFVADTPTEGVGLWRLEAGRSTPAPPRSTPSAVSAC